MKIFKMFQKPRTVPELLELYMNCERIDYKILISILSDTNKRTIHDNIEAVEYIKYFKNKNEAKIEKDSKTDTYEVKYDKSNLKSDDLIVDFNEFKNIKKNVYTKMEREIKKDIEVSKNRKTIFNIFKKSNTIKGEYKREKKKEMENDNIFSGKYECFFAGWEPIFIETNGVITKEGDSISINAIDIDSDNRDNYTFIISIDETDPKNKKLNYEISFNKLFPRNNEFCILDSEFISKSEFDTKDSVQDANLQEKRTQIIEDNRKEILSFNKMKQEEIEKTHKELTELEREELFYLAKKEFIDNLTKDIKPDSSEEIKIREEIKYIIDNYKKITFTDENLQKIKNLQYGACSKVDIEIIADKHKEILSLKEMSKKELVEEAKKLDIPGANYKTKNELFRIIRMLFLLNNGK